MESTTARKRSYMPHVDGLRCLAVMSVLLFHFGVPGLGGGYIGVDVFFVISGFLITNIIVDEVLSTSGFSFRNFYSRRIRRIVPALLATLAATTLLALLSLTPADLVAYGRSLAASAASVSNLLFWSESGYFDAASQTKPLLHTWSLSVEEQFYLFWPALIYLCFRWFGRKGLLGGIIVAGLLSYLANHLVASHQHVGYKASLFFLPQYRVFEFAIGATGCFLQGKLPSSRRLHDLMMAAGLALVVHSIATLREGIVFPYANAIAPCVGTLLIILARESTVVGVLFTNRVSVWIGKISYSLYLTHWPVVVFIAQYLPTADWGIRFAFMALLSLASAVILHYYVEVRFRHAGPSTETRRIVGKAVTAAATLCVLGAVILTSDGMTWRYRLFTPGTLPGSTTLLAISSAAAQGTPAAQAADESVVRPFTPLSSTEIDAGKGRRFTYLPAACHIESLQDRNQCFMDRPVQVLIFGNSHEPDAYNAFHHIFGKDERVNLISFGTVNNCDMKLTATSVSSNTPELACDQRFKVLNDPAFVRQLDIVVYNTHMGFDEVARNLWETMALLLKKNPSLRLVAIGSYLQTSAECSSLYNKHRTYDACKSEEFVNYWAPDERARSPIPEVKTLDYLYISKYELFCTDNRMDTCATFANGEPAFYDQHHLSLGFAEYMGDRIVELHRRDLADLGFPVPTQAH